MSADQKETTGPHPIDVHVGRKVTELRKRQGLTQSDLARACGITFQQIQKYETGANRISASRLHQIATLLAEPISTFFPMDGEKSDVDSPAATRQSIEIGRLAPRLSGADQKTVLALMRSLVDGAN